MCAGTSPSRRVILTIGILERRNAASEIVPSLPPKSQKFAIRDNRCLIASFRSARRNTLSTLLRSGPGDLAAESALVGLRVLTVAAHHCADDGHHCACDGRDVTCEGAGSVSRRSCIQPHPLQGAIRRCLARLPLDEYLRAWLQNSGRRLLQRDLLRSVSRRTVSSSPLDTVLLLVQSASILWPHVCNATCVYVSWYAWR